MGKKSKEESEGMLAVGKTKQYQTREDVYQLKMIRCQIENFKRKSDSAL
jgi:hypothetical protein